MSRPREFWIDEECKELESKDCHANCCHVFNESMGKTIHVIEKAPVDELVTALERIAEDYQEVGASEMAPTVAMEALIKFWRPRK